MNAGGMYTHLMMHVSFSGNKQRKDGLVNSAPCIDTKGDLILCSWGFVGSERTENIQQQQKSLGLLIGDLAAKK